MRFVLCFLLTVCALVPASSQAVAQDKKLLEEYYGQAVPAAEDFIKRLVKDGKTEPWDNMGVRQLMDHTYVIMMANIDLPENKRPSVELVIPLLELCEEMQDQNPESNTFGNFRWYWRTPEVTDRNAVEFIASHALPVWFDAKDKLPPQGREILGHMLRRSVDGCLKHRVRSDYTNIAIYNFVHLILLGQAFDRPDAIVEGEKRLNDFLYNVWDHGAFEYNSPTYYAVDLNALQLGLRYIKKKTTRETMGTLLELFWTDLSLNWYTPGLRQAGAQSRTYNYLVGVAGVAAHAESGGLAPYNANDRGVDRLNVLRGLYQPSRQILDLNKVYPRQIEQRWGAGQGQWMTSYILDDIALGTAGAPYRGARQNMVLTVDLADFEKMPDVVPDKYLPRNYFIADGREDPYGKNSYPTSNAGHQKPLHMEAFWFSAQRTVDALGVSIHTPETLSDPVLTNVQSHFVFRQTDQIYVDGKLVNLKSGPVEVGDKSVVMRYGNKAFGVRVPWTRDKDGQSPKAYLIDDGNQFGVYRLTIDHWGPVGMENRPAVSYDGLKAPTGAAFWVRIGSKLDSEQKFNDWSKAFASAKVEQLKVEGSNLSLQVAGVEGPVSVTASGLGESLSQLQFEPNGPLDGILRFNGKELGRSVLEKISVISTFSKRSLDSKSFDVNPKGTFWEAESGFSFAGDFVEANPEASEGKAVRVNRNFCWDMNVPQAGNYYLWARVFAVDPESDSFVVALDSKNSQGQWYGNQNVGDWHIGSGPNWRWIPLKLSNTQEAFPLKLDKGTYRLILEPREPDGQVDRFFLTQDPNAKPE